MTPKAVRWLVAITIGTLAVLVGAGCVHKTALPDELTGTYERTLEGQPDKRARFDVVPLGLSVSGADAAIAQISFDKLDCSRFDSCTFEGTCSGSITLLARGDLVVTIDQKCKQMGGTWALPSPPKQSASSARAVLPPAPPTSASTSASTSTSAPPEAQRFGAKHIVVQYRGAKRSAENVTRSREEAMARAEEADKRAKAGEPFEELAKQYSDEPGAGARGGNLGRWHRGIMDPAFQAAVEALRVGEVSDVVETAFGFHVILRTF